MDHIKYGLRFRFHLPYETLPVYQLIIPLHCSEIKLWKWIALRKNIGYLDF